MQKKKAKKPAAAPPAAEVVEEEAATVATDDDAVIPDALTESPVHTEVTSPKAEHLNDRMKLASKPNDGQPLAHRSRSKAGRKG